MYRAIIADDEKKIRLALRTLASWDELGICLIKECKDGDELCEQIETEKPDLVITDMKMPGICGDKLIQKIRELDPGVKLLVVSGYDEFEFVRQALVSRAIDYLLKPVMREDLNEALKKAVRELDLDQEIENRNRQARIQDAANRFLEGLDSGEMIREVLVKTKKDEKITEENGFFGAAVVFMEKSELERIRKENGLGGQWTVNGMAVIGVKDPFKEGIFIFLYHVRNGSAQRKLMEQLFLMTTDQGEIEAAMGVGCLYQDFEYLRFSCAEARIALSRRTKKSLVGTIYYEELEFKGLEGQEQWDNLKFLMEAAAANGNPGLMKKYCNLLFEQFGSDPEVTIRRLRAEFVEVFHMAEKLLFNCQASKEFYTELELLEEEVKTVWDVMDVCQRFSLMLDKLPQKELRGPAHYGTAYQIRSYLDKHFCEKISLGDLEERFFLNREYLSRIFKQEFTMGIFDYVDTLKIEQAKELLLKGYTTGYAAEQVGYYDESHFNRKFKKATGMTPKDFKNQKVRFVQKPDGLVH